MGVVYKCKESFTLPKYDEDGFFMDNENIIINVGDKFEISKNKLELARVAPAIKLISTSTSNPIWIEIHPVTLKEFFEEVNE